MLPIRKLGTKTAIAMFVHIVSFSVTLMMVRSCIAHMLMLNPKPYGLSTLDNSPLEKSGQDFPCKQREGVYEWTDMNFWVAGEAQIVSFLGSAVHGGGSCQFSISTDSEPTKSSQWKVIQSVIGGCPASIDGNFEDGPNGHNASEFAVVIPKTVPNGRYTFAWTWFNRKGNREMYMNCAPIIVSGGSKDMALLERFPDMFVANLPWEDCATIEELDYAFPQPGDFATTDKHAKIATTLNGAGCASMTRLGAGAGTMHYPEAALGSSSDYDSVQAVQKQTPPVDAAGSRTVADQTKSAVVAEAALRTNIPASKRTSQFNPVSSQQDSVSYLRDITTATTDSITMQSCVPCVEGSSVVCLDEGYFGLCNKGCAYPQRLAAGTYCSHGTILRHRR